MPGPQVLTDTWTSGGVEYTVTTERWTTETDAQWRARHAQAVADLQVFYPPD